MVTHENARGVLADTRAPLSTQWSNRIMTQIDRLTEYQEFLQRKTVVAGADGFIIDPAEVNPILKPHQRDAVVWAVAGGRRAIFASFGLGKSVIQLETVRLVRSRAGGRALIVCPLGVRQEFARDAAMLGQRTQFIRRVSDITESDDTISLTNYESVRDGKLDISGFSVVSLDEASCLRGFGGTKTFRTMMGLFEGSGRYRFVATATPAPNEYIELLAYAGFLDAMDIGQAKTRFFKRDSTKADKLTIHPHKEKEFWLWVASWGLFIRKPSDLGHSDEGYALPKMSVHYHPVAVDHTAAEPNWLGQHEMFRDVSMGVVEASREKRATLNERVEKVAEIVRGEPNEHWIVWHDQEAERHAIQKAIPESKAVWGSQDMEERERRIIQFSDGELQILSTKPVIAGSGCNFQRHCARAVFAGIGFKFNDFIQAIHRIVRFLQVREVEVHIVYAESEQLILRKLLEKWQRHDEMVEAMSAIIQEFGLSSAAMAATMTRGMGVERQVIEGQGYQCINNDAVPETMSMGSDSVGLILTSPPFSMMYEYSPNYADLGHTDNNDHFFQQMDFLTPELYRVLMPGRIAAIHVKDRTVPGGINGHGFQSIYPFHADCIRHYVSHGFVYMGMRTIVTDVVRENNQTYRLGWTEQCKDGSKMGCGTPEYLLLFRKPQSDTSKGYADVPVRKHKERYSRARWQIDAHGFWRSSGDRPLMPSDLEGLPKHAIFKLFKKHSLEHVYDYWRDMEIAESLDAAGMLPTAFMLLQTQSWHPEVWTDITRMLTLNGSQSQKNKMMHICLGRGSLVLTNEGYKPIQTVEVGDMVLTHKGRWRPVEVVKNTGIRPALSLRAQGVPGITLTPDHNVWTRHPGDYARPTDRARAVDPVWVRADKTLGGYVNQKLPPVEDHPVTEQECWLIGRWLADGHVGVRGDFHVSIGAEKLDDFLVMAGGYCGAPTEKTGCYQIRLKSLPHVVRALLRDCGVGASEKQVPAVGLALPPTKAKALLDGYLWGDGYFLEDRQRWAATSVSKPLLLGLSMLAQRAYGAIASVYPGRDAGETTIEGRIVQTKQEWVFSFDLPGDRRKKPLIMDDGAWKRVRSLDDVGEVETWCLQVAEDASFTAEGVIVKNCPMQIDLADRVIEQMSNPGDIVYDPTAGLMTVPYRAMKLGRVGIGCELSAPYWLDGAAYCQAMERELATPSLFDVVEAEAEALADDLPAELGEAAD